MIRFGKRIFDITPNSEHLFHLFLERNIGEVDAPVVTRKYLEVFIPRPGGQIVIDARQDDKRTLRGIRFLPEGDFIFLSGNELGVANPVVSREQLIDDSRFERYLEGLLRAIGPRR